MGQIRTGIFCVLIVISLLTLSEGTPVHFSAIKRWLLVSVEALLPEYEAFLALREEQAELAPNVSMDAMHEMYQHIAGPRSAGDHACYYEYPASYEAFVLRRLAEEFDLTPDQMRTLMERRHELFPSLQMSAGGELSPNGCPYTLPVGFACDAGAPYRNIDGSCNNLEHPYWGKSKMPLIRFSPSDYADHISAPRVDYYGDPLPSARKVSSELFEGADINSPVHTFLVMGIGQFADHDITLTAISTLHSNYSGEVDITCGSSGCQTDGPENEACFPIEIPEDDPFFINKTCMMFVRSGPAPDLGCLFGPRQQRNLITAFVDASMVYGSTDDRLDSLRDPDTTRGRLDMTPNSIPTLRSYLPQAHGGDDLCPKATSEQPCFLAGDVRANEQVGLATLHTIFARYHNTIEENLHNLNTHWNGETLFQESRRLLIAVWQYVLYNEFLPLVLGQDVIEDYGLGMEAGAYPGYDELVDPSIANVFATAAYRFGHSLITSKFCLSSNNYGKERCPFLSEMFGKPEEIYNNDGPGVSGVDNIVLGQVAHNSDQGDARFTNQITRHLFTDDPALGMGLDLSALNIQRGRDHGIPGYTKWREWCGLKVPCGFGSLKGIPKAQRKILKGLYERVEDIDLYAGAMSERRVKGGLVGPTFACIIAKQFEYLRFGDRFWFENQEGSHAFTDAQIDEIRKMSMAKIFCDNTDDIQTISPKVLYFPRSVAEPNMSNKEWKQYKHLYKSDDNERVNCSTLPGLDYTQWQEMMMYV